MRCGLCQKTRDLPIGGIVRFGTLKEYGAEMFLKTLISPTAEDAVIHQAVATLIWMAFMDIQLSPERTAPDR